MIIDLKEQAGIAAGERDTNPKVTLPGDRWGGNTKIEERLENWAKAQRMGGPRRRVIGSAEGRYAGDNPKPRSIEAMLVDEKDADEVERAWGNLLPFDKDVLRFHYIMCMDQRVICRKLKLPYRCASTFNMALAHAKREIARVLARATQARQVQLDRQRTHDRVVDHVRRVKVDIEELCKAVKTPADIRNLPGFVRKVNPAEVGLKRVIWPYSLKSEIQCALTNCGAHHKYGVLVELESGAISNIGHICGADEDKFSTKFTQEMARMGERRLLEVMMPVLLDRAALEQIERQVHAAYTLAQPWLRRKSAFAHMFTGVAHETARRMAAGESMAVTEVIERSSKEIDELVAAGTVNSRAEARYSEVRRGVIQGVAVWTLFEGDLEKMWRRCDALLAADPQAAAMSQIHSLYSDVYQLPVLARSVLDACEAGHLFFSESNFETLSHLPMTDTERVALRSMTLDKIDAFAPKKVSQPRSEEAPRRLSEKQRRHYRRAGLKPPG